MTQPHATKVLVIGYVWPEPRSSAAGGHMMQILETFLQQGWDVTFSSPAGTGEHRADLTVLGIREVPIELNNSSFDTFIGELAPDIVLFDRFMMEEQFGWRVEKHCPDALRVLETSDLQSLRDARHQRLKERLKTSDDANDFNELFAPASYVPPVSFEDCAHFLSIGNFRHAPNWDAVLWMKSTIWPLIREQLPKAQLHIYGAYTPPKATALHNPGQGFHVMNWAEDALKVMSDARVCLAPLRFGAGIKGKIVDAMLCGTPTITTPIGAEAMHGEHLWPGAVTRTAQAFADCAVQLYKEEALWTDAQSKGKALLADRYRQSEHGPALIEKLLYCQQHLAQLRSDNFTGSMLRHHHHKSTQYMAQWIEAKNRKPL